jgi:hypothetical protein
MIYQQHVVIREMPTGMWLNTYTGWYHKSAIHALKAVRRRDREITQADPKSAVVTVITWKTRTPIGTLVVKTIGGGAQ